MKKVRFLLIALPFFLLSCSKGGDSTTTPVTPPTPPPTAPTDVPLVVTVNVDPGSGNILGVVGTSQVIIAKISSTIPTAGVTISVTVTKDADNSTVFTTTNSSVAADNSYTITGLTPGVLCTANVVVTSKTPLVINSKAVIFKLAAK